MPRLTRQGMLASLYLRRWYVALSAMWLLEACRSAARGIFDVVVAATVWTAWNLIEPSSPSHSIRNNVIRAGGVATDAQPADHLAVFIQRNAAAEGDDAARDAVDPRPLRIEFWVERIGVVQSIKRSARLCWGVEVRSRDGELAVAESIRRERLRHCNITAARPRVAFGIEIFRADNRADNAFAIDDSRPHHAWREQSAIIFFHYCLQLALNLFDHIIWK